MSADPRPRRYMRARLWLASAMWVPVLAANAIAVGLALALPVVDEQRSGDGGVPITPAAAEQIFGALAAGMITFTGIIFSAVFVAAQIQTSSYSPRLAARLRRDPIVVAGLALPTATATYALFAIAAVDAQGDRVGSAYSPALTVLFALVLLVVTLGAFVALVQRAFELTQIGGIFRGLMRKAAAVIDDVHPYGAMNLGAESATADPAAATVVHEGPAAVVAAIDRVALVRLARETAGFVEVLPMVGQYVASGMPIVRIHGARRAPAAARAGQVLVLARQRTIDQDPAFALRMLVDIAIRALSPAVNDPTTAVQALDRIEELVVELYGRAPGPSLVMDAAGAPVGRVPAPGWTDYLELAVTEIRHYGGGSIQVGRRLHALYDHLLEVVDEAARPRVQDERRLLDEALARSFPDPREQAVAGRSDRLGLGAAASSASGDATHPPARQASRT